MLTIWDILLSIFGSFTIASIFRMVETTTDSLWALQALSLSDAYLGGLEFVGWCRDDFLGGGGSFLTGSSTMTICLAISESSSSSPEVRTHRYSQPHLSLFSTYWFRAFKLMVTIPTYIA